MFQGIVTSQDPPGSLSRAGAAPLPFLAALSAADAAAVRWKQHKELPTWRLVTGRREELLGLAGIRGNLAAGSGPGIPGQGPRTPRSHSTWGAVPGPLQPSCSTCLVEGEVEDWGRKGQQEGTQAGDRAGSAGSNLTAYSVLVIQCHRIHISCDFQDVQEQNSQLLKAQHLGFNSFLPVPRNLEDRPDPARPFPVSPGPKLFPPVSNSHQRPLISHSKGKTFHEKSARLGKRLKLIDPCIRSTQCL